MFSFNFYANNTQDIEEMLEEAINLIDQGFYGQSIKLLDEALKIEPKNFYLNYEKALAYSRNGEYAVSNKILAKLTKEKPINVHVYHLMGCNYSY